MQIEKPLKINLNKKNEIWKNENCFTLFDFFLPPILLNTVAVAIVETKGKLVWKEKIKPCKQ